MEYRVDIITTLLMNIINMWSGYLGQTVQRIYICKNGGHSLNKMHMYHFDVDLEI